MTINWSIEVLDSVSSTQEYIKSNIDALSEGACVQALRQENGHGRHGRVWQSPKGNLYISFLLKPECESHRFGQVAMLAGLAVVHTLKPYTEVTLKWPNDVLIDGRKICGILIEVVDGFLIVGVGINVMHAPIEGAACLVQYDLNVNDLRDSFLEQFATLYHHWQGGAFDIIRKEWHAQSFGMGAPMSVKIAEHKISGTYQGLDKAGHLLLLCDTSKDIKTITSGDVFFNHVTRD